MARAKRISRFLSDNGGEYATAREAEAANARIAVETWCTAHAVEGSVSSMLPPVVGAETIVAGAAELAALLRRLVMLSAPVKAKEPAAT